jgi:hypothetical protein
VIYPQRQLVFWSLENTGAKPVKMVRGVRLPRSVGRVVNSSTCRKSLKYRDVNCILLWNAEFIALPGRNRPASRWQARLAALDWSFRSLFTSYSQRLVSLSAGGLETIFRLPESQENLPENSELFSP